MTDSNETLLTMALCKFYRDPSHMERIMPIIEGNSDVSLRLIDYFVTGYVRRHNTCVQTVLPNGMSSHLNVHLSYRAQLQAYSKQSFDCFRRRERILFCYATDKSIETTIGQLNFFKWLLTHGILDYVLEHRAEIEQDMVHNIKAPQVPMLPSEQGNAAEALMKRFSGTTTLTFV
jgi:hypothetical protein